MIIIENNAAQLNEIIFKNRNKSYGAYAIRSDYGNTVIKSLGVTVLFFASISVLAFWLSNTTDIEKKLNIDGNIVPEIQYKEVTVDVTPPAKKAVTPPVVTPPAASASSTQAVSTNLNDHATEQQTQAVQSNEGTTNNGATTFHVSASENGGNTGTGTGDGIIEPVVVQPVIERMPDVMPAFDNMGAFLQHNLRYPAMALESNASGKVIVNFVIDEEGNIESATVLKGIGYGCDEEALRVIKLMKKWKPGVKNGKAVKVSFNQAIVFKLQ